MPAYAANIPADTDLLCESCGYMLNGLPNEGNCPECGTPIADSTHRSGRTLSPWETGDSLIHTSVEVTFRPARFYRSLKTRVAGPELRRARHFASIHWAVAGLLITLAIIGHYALTLGWSLHPAGFALLGATVILAFMFTAWGLTEAATRLTAWEASWRGYRLPPEVVRRALHYHAAHLLPAGGALVLIVFGYRLSLATGLLDFADTVIPYLYVLSATAIGAALYLFWTYWIGMRNLLYAND